MQITFHQSVILENSWRPAAGFSFFNTTAISEEDSIEEQGGEDTINFYDDDPENEGESECGDDTERFHDSLNDDSEDEDQVESRSFIMREPLGKNDKSK